MSDEKTKQINWGSVSPTGTPNPQELVEKLAGKYSDEVSQSEDARWPVGPMAPAPSPMKGMKK